VDCLRQEKTVLNHFCHSERSAAYSGAKNLGLPKPRFLATTARNDNSAN
jgi:hypothetical protein